MECKNCHLEIENTVKYCNHCGGKVISERVTGKRLWSDLFSRFLGWDNRFFRTVKALLFDPKLILSEYLDGARSKYVNPFKFFGIAAAIALIVFNVFSKDYMNMTLESMNSSYYTSGFEKPYSEMSELEIGKLKKHEITQLKYNEKVRKMTLDFTLFSLKYYSLVSFLILPLYAFMAFLVFRKPHNFGEHLVINAYIQGVSFLFMVLFFVIALVTNIPFIFNIAVFFTVILYMYIYSRLNSYQFKNILFKILRFLLLLLVIGVLFGIIGFLFAMFPQN